MKILIFNWRDLKHSWAGGGEIYIFEQATHWVKNGHDVTLFCGQDTEKKLPSFEIINGVKIYRKGTRYSLYFWAAWYYITRLREEADIVIDVENGIPFFTPFFCRKPKVIYVYHIHGKQFFYELPFPLSYVGYFIERFLFPTLYKNLPIIAISETTKQELLKLGFHKENIFIVYSGVEYTSVKKLPKKFSKPTILYLGRIKKYKRVDLLIKILPEIVKKVPNVRLIIAGWGTEASHIANLVMKSPLRRKIALLGPVSEPEKKSLLSKSWIFVNPSIGEGWSIAVIEANLYGTPAISFRVPGLIESIQDAKTGLLVGNEKEFIDKICILLTDNRMRESLSKSATIWAADFNWSRSAIEGLKILKKTQGKK